VRIDCGRLQPRARRPAWRCRGAPGSIECDARAIDVSCDARFREADKIGFPTDTAPLRAMCLWLRDGDGLCPHRAGERALDLRAAGASAAPMREWISAKRSDPGANRKLLLRLVRDWITV
jgi:hypothetical protein